MTTLYFIRHGETDWNRQQRFQGSRDIPLNDLGRLQAQALAAAWDRPADLVVSSPLSRARETAEILAAALQLPLDYLDRRLVERSYGQGEGLTLAERVARWPDGLVPGVEAPHSLKSRAKAFLHEVLLAFPGRRIVAVSHGGFINTVLGLVSRGEFGTGKSFLPNTSVTTVVHDQGRWTVREVGRSYRPR